MIPETTSRKFVLGTRVDRSSYSSAAFAATRWASKRESRYLCFITVYNVMRARELDGLQTAMNNSDLACPDGMPLVWALRILGERGAIRVYGPDFTRVALTEAQEQHIPVGFLGSTPEVLALLIDRVRQQWPTLEVPFAYAPPFRPLTAEEDGILVRKINASGAGLLFVGLGCPKQELWMAAHRGRVSAVMLGVGAAFDFLSESKPQAPRWMMSAGLEWLFRFLSEPKRLWKRYLKYNPLFVLLFALQLIRSRQSTPPIQHSESISS